MIRVFIADDQLLIRQGIRTLLEMDAEIVIAGEAEDGAETIERVPIADVDVLLLDVRMPRKSGVDVLRELSAIDALPPTLVLTTFDDTTVVLDAIRSGDPFFAEQMAVRAIHGFMDLAIRLWAHEETGSGPIHANLSA